MDVDQQFRRRPRNTNNSNPFDDDTVENNNNDEYNPRSNNRSSSRRLRDGSRNNTGAPPPDRHQQSSSTSSSTNNSNNNPAAATTAVPHDPLLDLYERRLHEDVDADFFNDPDDFQALNRVIDIIGAEIDKSGGNITPGCEIGTDFSHLPAYQRLQHQQRIVEEVIEHMAVKHCADLNSSVAAVGRMSRQFDEAKLRVRNLRRQVRDVKDSLRLGELGDVATDFVRLCTDCSIFGCDLFFHLGRDVEIMWGFFPLLYNLFCMQLCASYSLFSFCHP